MIIQTRLLQLVAILAISSLASPGFATEVEGVRSYRAPDHTRLVFDLDTPTEHRIFTLENPNRVVIDISNARLQGSLDTLDLEGTPVSLVRSGIRDGQDLRVVLDLKSSVQPRSFSLPRNEQYGHRLVVDLYDQAPRQSQPRVVASTRDIDNERRDIVVAISAGHGGEDPGAIGVGHIQEKQVVLSIAQEMKRILEQTPGYRPVLIREGDYYIDLRHRTRIAHDHNADFFVAIHADAFNDTRARGATIYALSQRGATSEHARRLAEKENAADLIGGVGSVSLSDKDEMLASVLLDLSMTASIASSLEAGEHIIASLADVIHMRRTNVEQAAFVVLKSPDIPSLLVEAGYITNPDDARNLNSHTYRQRFARALVSGITAYFHETPPRGTYIAWQKANGGGARAYTVVSGDNLSTIAMRHGVSLSQIKAVNGLSSNTIRAGQVLRIPGFPDDDGSLSFVEHTIRRGETLSGIASSYHVSLQRIRETNQLRNNDMIRPGQIIRIPSS